MATTKKAKTPAKQEKNLPAKREVKLRGDASKGTEKIGREDVALPFIRVLQSLSPELSKRNERFVEGAEEGDLLNTVTLEIYPGEEGVEFIPCFYEKVFNEWVPRDKGGGYVATYSSREDAYAQSDPENDVTDTANIYALVSTPEAGWQQAVISLTSTKLRSARRLNSLILMKKREDDEGVYTPPSFAYTYRLRTVETENDKGRFFVTQVEDGRALEVEGENAKEEDVQLYLQGKQFYELVEQGDARVDFTRFGEDGSGEGEDDEPAF